MAPHLETVLWMPAEKILPWANAVYLFGSFIIVLAGVVTFLASWTQNRANDVLSRQAQRDKIVLTTALAQADANLLREQRLTANERWRLERIEKAVLPRSIDANRAQQMVGALKGHFGRTSIATIQGNEPFIYAMQISTILKSVGIFGDLVVIQQQTDLVDSI